MIEMELTFTDSQGRLLVVLPSVLSSLLSYRQFNLSSNEAAGVLIGERRGSHLVVHQVSEPGKGDIRRRCFVDRRGPHHQAAVEDAFSRSSGRLQYLGEWHTHPEDIPSPSSTDLNSWKRYLVADEPMVLLIVGRKEIWAAKKCNAKVIPLLKIR
ncbi:CBASS system CD-NTase/cGAS isopeptidase Cap3 [Halomonas sp. GT]|uniref:CBASS system CD-NTase/cGAS isopeptidase Cap3 n=1 Tax=Halomonas sp. GT TaxID=1971364 RepID=UPI0009F71F5A|nr:Mov34/MPN/PAD-1 family protein [Halomonas sp. GT]